MTCLCNPVLNLTSVISSAVSLPARGYLADREGTHRGIAWNGPGLQRVGGGGGDPPIQSFFIRRKNLLHFFFYSEAIFTFPSIPIPPQVSPACGHVRRRHVHQVGEKRGDEEVLPHL